MINTQLEKEAHIRSRVAEIDSAVDPALRLSGAAIRSHPTFFASAVVRLLDLLFVGFGSPVTAKKSCQIFTDLRRSVFSQQDEDDTLPQTVAAVTLQFMKPSCPVEFVR